MVVSEKSVRENFASNFPAGFSWALFPIEMSLRQIPPPPPQKKWGSKIKILEYSVSPKPTLSIFKAFVASGVWGPKMAEEISILGPNPQTSVCPGSLVASLAPTNLEGNEIVNEARRRASSLQGKGSWEVTVTQEEVGNRAHTNGGVQQRTLLRRVLRRVLETAFEKVLRRVLRRCLAVVFNGKKGSEKGS